MNCIPYSRRRVNEWSMELISWRAKTIQILLYTVPYSFIVHQKYFALN